MNEERKFRQYLFRLIPVLLLVSFLGWCSTSNKARQENTPVKTELMELMMESGMVDSPVEKEPLAKVAKRAGEAAMNRLLYDAAPTASLGALKWIVENGADPRNVGAMQDQTLLQRVAKLPRPDRLEYFLNLGLDPLERTREGKTLLHIAAGGGVEERALALLTAKGLKLTDTTRGGQLPIHFANVKSLAVLVAAGAEVDAKDAELRTPLHGAAANGNNELVTELLRLNASVFAADNKGRTPLHLATLGRFDNVKQTLIAAGAPQTARDQDGDTPADLETSSTGRNRRTSQH